MLDAITDLPAGVIGFKANGKLHSDDYKDVLIPAIEAGIASGEKLRVLLVFPAFEGLSSGAMWQDLKMGVEHLSKWKKIALVTDVEWMVHATKLFGWMTPGEMKDFPLAEQDKAIEWLATG